MLAAIATNESQSSPKSESGPSVPAVVYDPLFAIAILSTSIATLYGAAVYKRHFKRLSNAEWITPNLLTQQRWVRGIVTSVGDSDNFHVYHIPRPSWIRSLFVPQTAKALRGNTIHIRMAGIDAPELSHFGKPAQEYGPKAQEWLKSTIYNKIVWCQMHKRDQYQRIVASVYYRPRLLSIRRTNLSLEMLRAGWAITYDQSGGVYGREGKEKYMEVEAKAQTKRQGMWRHGTDLESPAEYKKRHKNAAKAET